MSDADSAWFPPERDKAHMPTGHVKPFSVYS